MEKEKSKASTKVIVTCCHVSFSAQLSTSNSYNFYNTYPNWLKQVFLESLEILFLDGSSGKAFGATVWKLQLKVSKWSRLD